MAFITNPRKSIHMLFSSSPEAPQRKPHSFVIERQGANIKQEKITEVRIELEHAKMQLQAEEQRVTELENSLNSVVQEKFQSESNLITRLRESLDALRRRLALIIEGKQELASATAKEIDRLRDIIRLLTDQLLYLTAKNPVIHTFGDMDSLKDAFAHNERIPSHLLSKRDRDFRALSSVAQENLGEEHGKEDEEKAVLETNLYTTPGGSTTDALQLVQDTTRNTRHKLYFPHINPSQIDCITLEPGNDEIYPDPYATVDIIYSGYIYTAPVNDKDRNAITTDKMKVPGNWIKFTSDDVSNTVFSTQLGVGQNIIGLEQAVLSMTLGQKVRIWVPSRLGYGKHGAGELIPANSDLIFDIKLVAIGSGQVKDDEYDDDQVMQVDFEPNL